MRSIKCYFPISILCQYLPYIYGSLQNVLGSSCIAIILVVCLLFNFIHICRDISYFLIIHNNIANKLITSKIKGRCTPFKLLYPPSHFKRERESKQTKKLSSLQNQNPPLISYLDPSISNTTKKCSLYVYGEQTMKKEATKKELLHCQLEHRHLTQLS